MAGVSQYLHQWCVAWFPLENLRRGWILTQLLYSVTLIYRACWTQSSYTHKQLPFQQNIATWGLVNTHSKIGIGIYKESTISSNSCQLQQVLSIYFHVSFHFKISRYHATSSQPWIKIRKLIACFNCNLTATITSLVNSLLITAANCVWLQSHLGQFLHGEGYSHIISM